MEILPPPRRVSAPFSGGRSFLLPTFTPDIVSLSDKPENPKVIVTSSSDAKRHTTRQLGADHTINYKNKPDWAKEVLALAGGKGADIIVENGGQATMGKLATWATNHGRPSGSS